MERKADVFDNSKKEIPGIDFNEQGQLSLLEKFKKDDTIFEYAPEVESAYYNAENSEFIMADAWALNRFLSVYKPKKVIEVGSGYSSMVMLDFASHAESPIELTFIEPYPNRFKEQLKNRKAPSFEIKEKLVQNIDLELFKQLEAGDLLFIDSSHVCKTASDLHYLLFEVLPILPKGCFVHFHDITYPFEYPVEWFEEGRYWNENYLVRALLMFSNKYNMLYFNHFICLFHKNKIPQFIQDQRYFGGGSLYLEIMH